MRPRMAGRWTTASRSSSCCRPKACSMPSSSRACSIPPTSNSAKPPSRFSRRSSASSRAAWCSTACPRSGCWRKARCATGGRSWRSSITSRRHGTTVLLLDDLTAESARQDRAQRRPRRDPAGGAGAGLRRRAAAACASSNIAAQVPRRLSRLHHQHRRRRGVSAAGGRRSTAADFDAQRAVRAASPNSTQLLGGGIERGLEHADPRARPAPASRCSAINFVVAAIARGEKAALFVFDEELGLLFDRMKASASISQAMRDSGNLHHRAGRRRRTVARRIRPPRPRRASTRTTSRPW